MSVDFKAFIIDKQDNKDFECTVKSINLDYLVQDDILVEVEYSSLNYKDALAITNKGKIAKQFPFIPGIDFAGTVVESKSNKFKIGDKVICTGFGVGEKYFGGYCQYVNAKEDWLTLLPNNISTKDAMFVGTGGFTAMLCVNALLEHNTTPEQGEILVSGASGGVGSWSVLILSNLGFDVIAMSSIEKDYLFKLGAKSYIDTASFSNDARPLDTQKYSGAIDVVGGNVLANMLSCMNYGSSIACCGLAGGYKLNTTVMPFILRGVNLLGIDSVYYPAKNRQSIWGKISKLIKHFDVIERKTIRLEELHKASIDMLNGNISGRVIVEIKDND